MSRFAFVCQSENTNMTASGTKNRSPRRAPAGRNGASSRNRAVRLRETTVSGAGSTPLTTSTVTSGRSASAEDLVEERDRLVGRCAGALEDDLREHLGGLAVQVAVGLVLLALVGQDLVGLFVEQRPSVGEEVLGDQLGLLRLLEEGLDQRRVGAALDDHLAVMPADGA